MKYEKSMVEYISYWTAMVEAESRFLSQTGVHRETLYQENEDSLSLSLSLSLSSHSLSVYVSLSLYI